MLCFLHPKNQNGPIIPSGKTEPCHFLPFPSALSFKRVFTQETSPRELSSKRSDLTFGNLRNSFGSHASNLTPLQFQLSVCLCASAQSCRDEIAAGVSKEGRSHNSVFGEEKWSGLWSSDLVPSQSFLLQVTFSADSIRFVPSLQLLEAPSASLNSDSPSVARVGLQGGVTTLRAIPTPLLPQTRAVSCAAVRGADKGGANAAAGLPS